MVVRPTKGEGTGRLGCPLSNVAFVVRSNSMPGLVHAYLCSADQLAMIDAWFGVTATAAIRR
jgi:hypothetical protein